MKCFGIVCVLLSVIFIDIGDSKRLPPFLKPCRYHDPNINECMKRTYDEIHPYLLEGIPAMKIPRTEPLFVPEVSLDTGKGTATGLKAVFTNLYASGAKVLVLKNFDVDLDAPSFKVDADIPLLSTHSNYTLDGNILILQLRGRGHGYGNFSDIHARLEFSGNFFTKKGKRYIDWTDRNVHLTVGSGSLYFENLIDGNKELSDQTNQVLNENSEAIIAEFVPLVEETVSSIVYNILKNVFHTYAVEELFPLE